MDRNALVTGASSGIGRAIAVALSGRGFDLHLVGRDKDRLACAARDMNGRARVYVSDLADPDSLARLTGELEGSLQGLDLLVHSAGVFAAGPIASLPVEELDRQYRVNMRAPYVLTQALLASIRARDGQIVFINSSAGAGLHGSAHTGAYAATKQGLRALADALRAEVNADGVRVLSVYPGRTATPMQESIHAREGKHYDAANLLQPEDIAAAVLNALDLPRTAELTDLMIRPMRKTVQASGPVHGEFRREA